MFLTVGKGYLSLPNIGGNKKKNQKKKIKKKFFLLNRLEIEILCVKLNLDS